MKTVVNNLVWLALFLLMASASVYPSVSPVSQAVIWVINSMIAVVGTIALAAACVDDNKDRLEKLAGTRNGVIRRAFGWIKFTLTFSAVAYAGFTVAAVFYVAGACLVLASVTVARERMKAMQ